MKVIVGFSGGVSSAWCAGWALRMFKKEDVVFLFHDTKEEDPDTYRFIKQMAAKLDHPVTERSDGRSVTEIFDDENAIANNRMAFCSRILKAEQRDRYFKEVRETEPCKHCGSLYSAHTKKSQTCPAGYQAELFNILGFSAVEWQRVQRASARAEADGYVSRFPMIEDKITKQAAADWCLELGVRPPLMYTWSEHANCVGCVRGGKAYWLAVAENAPEIFEQRAALEERFGHTILKDTTLRNLVKVGLKRKVKARESIEIGPCDCGD
jgi:hypothetical protein